MPQTAPIVTTPVCEIVVKGILATGGAGQAPCGNVFYYRLSNMVLAPTKAALSTIFQATVVAPLLLAANIRYTPVQLGMRFIDDAIDLQTFIAAAGTGAIATDGEPSVDAVVVNLKSAFRGKAMRGFKHFGAVNEIDTTNDILTGAGLARWQAVRDGVKTVLVDAIGNTWTPFIRSRYLEQVKVNPTTIRGVDIVNATLTLNVRTMRKRRTPTLV